MATIYARPRMGAPLPFAEPGVPAPAFTLSDVEGRTVRLENLRGRAVVLFFTSARSAACALYQDRFDTLARRYAQDGRVRFYAIDIDRADLREIRVEALVSGRSFATLVDSGGTVAALYSVRSAHDTPQVAIVDPSGLLRYRGPLDDSLAVSSVRERYAARTLEDMLASDAYAAAFSAGGSTAQR